MRGEERRQQANAASSALIFCSKQWINNCRGLLICVLNSVRLCGTAAAAPQHREAVGWGNGNSVKNSRCGCKSNHRRMSMIAHLK
jgi:hypothetical protein